jgi:hypothetical protein
MDALLAHDRRQVWRGRMRLFTERTALHPEPAHDFRYPRPLAVARGIAIGRAVLVASSRVDVAHYFVEAHARSTPKLTGVRAARNAVIEEIAPPARDHCAWDPRRRHTNWPPCSMCT